MPDKDANHSFDEFIRRSTEMAIPVEVEERMRRRLFQFRTRVEQRPPDRIGNLFRSLTWRPLMRVMAMTAALLVAVGAGFVLIPRESPASRVFAAAAAQLRNSPSLQYTIVLNDAPYVAVDFSYLAPGYRRINCSWGIEVRTDGATGRQIVLMHGARTYLLESGKQVESQANIEDFAERLRSLPQKADEVLGEQGSGGKRLIGYRLRHAPPNGSISGLKALDLWVNVGTGEADHVDIAIQEQGKPVHQMHIRNIRSSAEEDRSLFDLAPPVGYTAMPLPGNRQGSDAAGSSPSTPILQAKIVFSAPLSAVVLPMQGSYDQAPSAVHAVQSYLTTRKVIPVGSPFGRFGSEKNWDVGYPVPPETVVEAPFQLVSLFGTLTASAVVNGAWGQDSGGRWAAFLKSIVEQGYAPAGPAMEIWSGEDTRPGSQFTEMRMPVTQGK
jgi:hypothetical protein